CLCVLLSPPTAGYTFPLHDALPIFSAQAEGRDDRRVRAVVQAGERGVHTRQRAGSVEGPGQYLVEVDRAGELTEHLVPPSLFLGDRKSTRLNSSHVAISYAVFCLKK